MNEWLPILQDAFPAIVIVFALAGVALLAMLAATVARPGNTRWRKTHPHDFYPANAESFSDLLQFSSVIEDGIIYCKNGSLLAGWRFRGKDVDAATGDERTYFARQLNTALLPLGTNWMLHCDLAREVSPAYSDRLQSHFPDAVSQALDDERRAYFTAAKATYESTNVLVVAWYPPRLTQQKMVAAFAQDDQQSRDQRQKIIDDFKRELSTLEDRLRGAFDLTRLRSYPVEQADGATVIYDDLLRWLHRCATGDNHRLRLPTVAAYIDALIGGQDFTVDASGYMLQIDNRYVQTLSIEGFPADSWPNILETLARLNCEYRWSSRFIFLDRPEALARIEKALKKWQQKVRGFVDAMLNNVNGRLNQDAVKMVADAGDMQEETHSGLVGIGYYNSTIVLMHENAETLAELAREVKRRIDDQGFNARIETVNNCEAFIGSIPGHGEENIRETLISTLNLAHLLPTGSLWLGETVAPAAKVNPPLYPPHSPALMYCVTDGASPFRLNLHVGDLGHTIIFGPTGAGKSVLLATLAAQFLRYPDMTVFYFDKGMSVFTLCQAVGGQHYDIGETEMVADENGGLISTARYAFCPLQYLDDAGDVAWATEYLATLCELGGMQITAKHRNLISATLLNMQRSGDPHRSLEDAHTQLAAQDEQLGENLKPYTKEGQFGFMLAADRDGLDLKAQGGLCVFEIEELMAMGDDRVKLPVLLYLFRRIEKNLKGQPAVIVLDEAWLMLGHKVFRDKIREWFKVLRKANCAVVLATQSLSDATNSGILDVIVESTATKIFLPNPRANGEDARELYRRFGLNSQQIDIIARASAKREYYYTSARGNRKFELALGELELALCAVSDKESVAEVKRLITEDGDGWLAEWLRRRHVSEEKIQTIITPEEKA
jgi:type IV secretion system protein VirB4